MVVVTHPTGNSNVRAILEAFNNSGILAEFNTTIAINPTNPLLKLIPKTYLRHLLRRSFLIPKTKLSTQPFLEVARLVNTHAGIRKFIQKEGSWSGIDSVYKGLDACVSKKMDSLIKKKGVNAVYSYEDGALKTFLAAKQRGLTCIYDLPIAYWETSRKLLQEEGARLPEWALTIGGGITDSAEKLERKTRELELADVVIAPGSFVVQSLPIWANTKKIVVSPFGSPMALCFHEKQFQNCNKNKLRILFVGSMSQRKGLSDLFSAFKLLKNENIELIVMGSTLAPLTFYKEQYPLFTYLPTRPHNEVLELMRSCDVLCLPSIIEGRALVMQEAMSQGLPLIITENTGGADLIIEGQTGFLVPIRSPAAIAAKLNWFLENKSTIPDMSRIAQAHASKYTWKNYGDNILSGLGL